MYQNIFEGKFISRPNRFVALVEIDGREETVHVKNTGRCKELLQRGCTVYLEKSDNPARKTQFDLVAVEKERAGREPLLVNMDSQAPNKVFEQFLRDGRLVDGITRLKPEYTYGDSRFDFYLERGEERHFIEVKGVTLEEEGHCRFPDAPTERGVKHLLELASLAEEGRHCWICFVVQMEGMVDLRPNDATDPKFGDALRQAARAGVNVCAFGCHVEKNKMEITYELPVILA